MEVELSKSFVKDYLKIKDKGLRKKVHKALVKLAQQPRGKPPKYGYKGNRRLRVDPFRILYYFEGDKIIVKCFEHRDKVY